MIYNKYYRVYKNCTDVAVVSANDFSPIHVNQKDAKSEAVYHFPPDKEMFYEYSGLVKAMEGAKSGALRHIGRLIKEGEAGIPRLKQYRITNYENLNITLRDSNIRRIEREIKTEQI